MAVLRRYALTDEEKTIIRNMAGRVPMSVIARVIGRKKATVMTFCVNNSLPTKLLNSMKPAPVTVVRESHPVSDRFIVNIPKELEGHVKVVLV